MYMGQGLQRHRYNVSLDLHFQPVTLVVLGGEGILGELCLPPLPSG